MISDTDFFCPLCGGGLKYYDSVKRILKTKNGIRQFVRLKRFRCLVCGSAHRSLPDNVMPYKHYEKDIVEGVVEGLISSATLGFEDYPCEATMERWRTEFSTDFVCSSLDF